MNNSNNKLSIITTTYNCRSFIEEYFLAFSSLDTRQFDWIVIDGGSSDGTDIFLADRRASFSHFSVQPDAGVYFGFNNALAQVKTEYYMVFGVDDKPSPSLIDDLDPLLHKDYSLILGAVRVAPSNYIKRAGTRHLHWISWGRAISHHSVGTVIKKDVHDRFGLYDTNYPVCADGKLLKSILMSSESILFTDTVFGEFRLGGLSSKHKLRSIIELFLIQVQADENLFVQLFLFNVRVLLEVAIKYKTLLARLSGNEK